MRKLFLLLSITSAFLFSFLFLNPSKTLAQSCTNPSSCATAGQQSSCCSGYTCRSAGIGNSCVSNTPDSCTNGTVNPSSCTTDANCCSGYSCQSAGLGKACVSKTPTSCTNGTVNPSSCTTDANCCSGYTCQSAGIGKACQPPQPTQVPYDGGSTNLACVRQGNSFNFSCKTAIGNISTDSSSFIKSLLRIILGLAGGILLILIILNGYKLMTSQGDPEKIKDAREGIIAAISGILLIIFSLVILQIITVNILGLPGFGG